MCTKRRTVSAINNLDKHMRVILPWPPKSLSPNARVHWGKKAKHVKKYRADCYVMARLHRPVFKDASIPLTITFCPPDASRRDHDNMIAAFKAGADGVAQAWGVDDSRFIPSYRVGTPVRHGAVIVEVAA